MQSTQVISKFVTKKIDELKERGEPTAVQEHVLNIISMVDVEPRHFENQDFEATLFFSPKSYKETHNDEVTLFGQPSYIIRTKSNNHVISGYINDIGIDKPKNSFSRNFEERNMPLDEFNTIDLDNLLKRMSKDTLLSEFSKGVAIDRYDLEGSFHRSITTNHDYNDIHKPYAYRSGLENKESDYVGTKVSQLRHFLEYNHNYPDSKRSIFLDSVSLLNSPAWMKLQGFIRDEDLEELTQELRTSIDGYIDHITKDVYLHYMSDGLPDTISEDDLVDGKYNQSELNFIRHRSDDPHEDSPKYRHQYIDTMRSNFDIVVRQQFTDAHRYTFHRAGLNIPSDQLPSDWYIHTMLMSDPSSETFKISPDAVNLVNNGRIPTQEFVDKLNVSGTNRKSFDKFMKLMKARTINAEGDASNIMSLTTLPKEILDPDVILERHNNSTDDHEFKSMLNTLSPYLVNYSREITKAKEEYLNNPSAEAKVRVKELSAKYNWLTQGAKQRNNKRKSLVSTIENLKRDFDLAKEAEKPNSEVTYEGAKSSALRVQIRKANKELNEFDASNLNIDNFLSLKEKLKGDTLRDYGNIMGQYLEAIKNRIASELSDDLDNLFTINLEHGSLDVVSFEADDLFEHATKTLEEEYKESDIQHYAYNTLMNTFVEECGLSEEVMFEGLDHVSTDNLVDLTSYRNDSHKILTNLESHYPDEEWISNKMEAVLLDVQEYESYYEISDRIEKPSEIDGRDLFKFIASGSSDYKRVLELNEMAHTVQSKYQKELSEYGKDKDFSWTALFEDKIDIGDGLKIENISSKNRLLDEAITQQHCVFSYLQRAMHGESIILSVTNENDERVATVELTHDVFEDFDIEQCYGRNNDSVSSSISGAVELFVDKLNNDPEEELGIEMPDEITAEIDIDDAEERPSKYASMLSQIPFETDAAHKAYFILDELTPDEFDLESFLCENSWQELYYNTKFAQEINDIKSIVSEYKQHEVTPFDVISIKTELGNVYDGESIRAKLETRFNRQMSFEEKLSKSIETAQQPSVPKQHQEARQQPTMRL
ncbi:PcfJ domain-containing protein [Vibrio sp. D431a]|uniref:PcfJ domain-containing protein n=1 Tax=Vibrio sp. D431a TaxID=2837388 RepID=UPI002552CE53|nr:PcfJ domain-containing protein [Vibrio sp. D431a]MDK9793708.1 PcfJ domain-containing protein [Vibrio sp. D431a]